MNTRYIKYSSNNVMPETWNLFTTNDLFMTFMAFLGFAAVAIILKTAFKVNSKG